MDIFADIRMQYLSRMGMHEDELGIVLKGHLFVEYLLNRIIKHKIVNSKKYLDLKFSQKVILLDKHKLIPIYIQQNIKRLNSFRNNYVHSLDYVAPEQELLYTKKPGENISIKSTHYKGKYPHRHYYRILVNGVLTELTNHMLLNLKVSPFWNEDYEIIFKDSEAESFLKNLSYG